MKYLTPTLLGIVLPLLVACSAPPPDSVTLGERYPGLKSTPVSPEMRAELETEITKKKATTPSVTVLRWYLSVFAACPKGAPMTDKACAIRRAKSVTADSTFETEHACNDAAERLTRAAAIEKDIKGTYDTFWRCVDTTKNNVSSKERQVIYKTI